jgi:hypothetical protein
MNHAAKPTFQPSGHASGASNYFKPAQTMKTCTSLTLALLSLLLALSSTSTSGQTPTRTVEAAVKPGGKWVAYPTRTLADVPGAAALKPDTGLSRYGGLTSRKEKATGFFHTAKLGGR